VKASLLIVMNERNMVSTFKIVPTDERKHIEELLGDIWTLHKEQSDIPKTKVVFTDNVRVDQAIIQSKFKGIFPEHNVEVLQV
jgi:hypothetical protein